MKPPRLCLSFDVSFDSDRAPHELWRATTGDPDLGGYEEAFGPTCKVVTRAIVVMIRERLKDEAARTADILMDLNGQCSLCDLLLADSPPAPTVYPE
jgi:hypothetical protein